MNSQQVSRIFFCFLLVLSPVFANAQAAAKASNDYGNNIIRFAPFTTIDEGAGFSAAYEYVFGQDKMLGVSLPVSWTIVRDYGYTSDALYNNYLHFMPGIKVYPWGQRKVNYSFGPSLLFTMSEGYEWMIRSGWSQYELADKSVFRFSMLVNNYLNVQLGKSFNFGVELGLGVRYFDRTRYSLPTGQIKGTSRPLESTGQMQLTFGYRF